ncbi:MAG: hypothetical protein ACR2OV_06995 [Hyphomicrobiaceae bacterium]
MPLRTVGLSVIALIGLTSSAVADVITGEWCEPGGGGRILIINNYDDVTSVGKAVKANVDRHHVDFVIPTGEKDAGIRFDADQLSDEQIKVTIGANAAVIWTPCKPIS